MLVSTKELAEGRTSVDGGRVEPIIPNQPDTDKFARCTHCSKCGLIVVSRDDIVPPDVYGGPLAPFTDPRTRTSEM